MSVHAIAALVLLLLALLGHPSLCSERRIAGDAAFRAGDLGEAEAHYRAALKVDENDIQALSNLATVLYHRHLHQDDGALSPSQPSSSSTSYAAEIAEIIVLYRRALELRPAGKAAAMLNFNLGSALLKLGKMKEARAAFERALTLEPDFPAAAQNLGALQQEIGALGEAEASYRRSLATAPRDASLRQTARKNLWSLLKARGRHRDLLQSYKSELEITPDSADIHNDIGALLHLSDHWHSAPGEEDAAIGERLLKEQSQRIEDALEHYHAAIKLDRNHRAHINIGLAEVHRSADREEADGPSPLNSGDSTQYSSSRLWADRALFHFKRGLQGSEFLLNTHLDPEGDPIYFNRRSKLLEKDKSDVLQKLTGKDGRMTCAIQRKLLHDAAQIRYILSEENLSLSAIAYYEVAARIFYEIATSDIAGGLACQDRVNAPVLDMTMLREILSRVDTGDADWMMDVLAGSWRKAIHIAAPSPFPMANPIRKSSYSNADWGSSVFLERNILVVDNFLTDEALRSLRRYLLTSSIWNTEPKESFVGATISEGIMTHPVTVQLPAEIAKAFPRIFCREKRRLKQAWAYSYHNFEGVQQEGIGIHADESAINANLWIGSDETNAEDENGLVVYGKEAPLEWDFKEYNNAGERARARLVQFLEDSPWYNIKFRNNRLVLFNGNMFHKSMPLAIGAGYNRRRINLTFLFGQRGAQCHSQKNNKQEL